MKRGLQLTMVAALLVCSSALADQKRMAANNCELYDDTSVFYDRGGARMGAPEVSNLFICPILRDNTTNTGGLNALKVNVYKGKPDDVICVADSYDQNGSILKSVARSVPGLGIVAVDFDDDLDVSSAYGSYGVACLVAPFDNNGWGHELFSIDYDE